MAVSICPSISAGRPIKTTRLSSVQTCRKPVVKTAIRKRKRFGENTGIGSGEKLKIGIYENLLTKSLLFDIIEVYSGIPEDPQSKG